ncbi:hypothetical protein CRUP_001205 [Coryphaenoides rupestris]|nr:hypothetical protein CRUP_001204 [Coryphaenoides rupestris]KAG7263873.1 hypothetical protein CRUP_001205 [Coryphaenoides rupestris]
MLMRNTMMKKIHMKNLSITLATFFHSAPLAQVVKNIQYIANCFREQRATCAKGAEWKKVAKVMDRFFMWIFFIMVFLMSILIFAKAT